MLNRKQGPEAGMLFGSNLHQAKVASVQRREPYKMLSRQWAFQECNMLEGLSVLVQAGLLLQDHRR